MTHPHHNTLSFDDIRDGHILIVDDEPVNCKIVQRYLELEGLSRFSILTDSREAVKFIASERPDILLLDLMMPHVSGLDILREVRASPHEIFLPVLVLTAKSDSETKREALELGATDFLSKPVDANELGPRVKNLLWIRQRSREMLDHANELERQVRERTAEIVQSRLDVVRCLGRAAEFRDNETGMHVVRVGKYVGILARELGVSEELASLYELASPLHDVGKIGIPDAVLLKPGRLNREEMDLMKRHCSFGASIVGQLPEETVANEPLDARWATAGRPGRLPSLLEVAAVIAQSHHERWDGTGYPLGLSREEIPLPGRITAVADVFDALTSARPYKPAFSLERALSIMRAERGKQFDPSVMDAFERGLERIEAVRQVLSDAPSDGAQAA